MRTRGARGARGAGTHRVEDVDLDPQAVEVLLELGRRKLGRRARPDEEDLCANRRKKIGQRAELDESEADHERERPTHLVAGSRPRTP